MTEKCVLSRIIECSNLTEMDFMPEVAFSEDEDGDTRFLDDGSFVIYSIKTNLKAKNIKKIVAKDPWQGGPCIAFKLNCGDDLVLTSKPDKRFHPDKELFKQELIQKYAGVPLFYEQTMDENEILEKIEKCGLMTEMDDMPLVAYSDYEDGDTRFDANGYFIIYNIKTSIRAKDFLAIQYKGNENFTRDPYMILYFSHNRHLLIRCIPGHMGTADTVSLREILINQYNGVPLVN